MTGCLKQFIQNSVTRLEYGRGKAVVEDAGGDARFFPVGEFKGHAVAFEDTSHVVCEFLTAGLTLIAVVGVAHITVIGGIFGLRDKLVGKFQKVEYLAI